VTVASAELNGGNECNPLVAVEKRMVLHKMRAQYRRLGRKVRVELFAGETSGRGVQSGVGQCELRLQSDLFRRRA
jgi:hypothetical protein